MWSIRDATASGAVHGLAGKAMLVDIGGVLIPDYLPAAATAWDGRLRMSPRSFLGALYGGSDDQVLIGRVSESLWWSIVADRLQIGPQLLTELQRDLAARQIWDDTLVSYLRRLRGRARTAIVSNAWPSMRARMRQGGLLALVDQVVLSCEVGYAKPDARI